jgi:phosphatidylinositol dimannoside acyltransferase
MLPPGNASNIPLVVTADGFDAPGRRTVTTGGPWALDGELWRRAARWGSTRGPAWFVRASPPVIGAVACALAPERRRAIARNLRRARGDRGPVRDTLDVLRTFATYASCLAETLGAGSTHDVLPKLEIHGELHVVDACARGAGLIIATAHTAGWEAAGPLVARDLGLRVMIAETPEPDPAARRIQDEARATHGVLVAHIGEDPLAALPLLRHLRGGGAVALQIDRTPSGVRTRAVRMFGQPAFVPEGPLRLAGLTGAPIIPIFCARVGYRHYLVQVSASRVLARGAGDAELDDAAQHLADSMQDFVRAHPTDWFAFD